MNDENPRIKELEDHVAALKKLVEQHHKALALVSDISTATLGVGILLSKGAISEAKEHLLPMYNQTLNEFNSALNGEEEDDE